MDTIIRLNEEEFKELRKTINRAVKSHGKKEFDRDNEGWKIEFIDGKITVWHGRFGVTFKDVE